MVLYVRHWVEVQSEVGYGGYNEAAAEMGSEIESHGRSMVLGRWLQLMPVLPCCLSSLFASVKCPQPKNPLLAESGEG